MSRSFLGEDANGETVFDVDLIIGWIRSESERRVYQVP
jgi:hypothetical protein